MPCHIDQNVASIICEETFASRRFGAYAVGEEADKIFHSDFVTTIVNFDIVAVQVHGSVRVAVDCAWKGVSRVAGHVIREHEDDLRVGNPKALYRSVHGKDIGEMSIVEPETRRCHEDSPVARVLCDGDSSQQSGGHHNLKVKVEELHRDQW